MTGPDFDLEILEPDAAGLARAAELLRAGAVIAFPTDTVYGLAARAADAGAIDRIFEIKGRSRDRSLVLMPSAPSELPRWVRLDSRARSFMARYWPGPLTLVLPAAEGVGPPLAAANGTLGVRMPDHIVALQLLEELAEAIATTSANRHGEEPAILAGEAAELEGIAAVIDGGRVPGGRPSTVLDLSSEQPVVLREGPITGHELLSP